MNIKEKLNFRIAKPEGMPEEHFEHIVHKYEMDLGYSLIQSIKDGNFYSVKMNREIIPSSYDDGVSYDVAVELHIGNIKPVELRWKPPQKIGFIQRIKILFTGEIPLSVE